MRSVLRIFLVFVFLLSLQGMGQVEARPLAAPSVSANPASASPGGMVQVKGAGFSAQAALEVRWDAATGRVPTLGYATTGADGSAVVNVIIPPNENQPGGHTLWLVNAQNPVEAASVPVTVNAFNRKAAYIYQSDTTTAASFQTLLNANGVTTTLVPLSSITLSTSFSAYDLVLIGPDSGNLNTWGNLNQQLAVLLSGKPILGLGEGGYALFGKFGLPIGYPNGAHLGQVSTITAGNLREPIFSSPNVVPAASNVVTVLNKAGTSIDIPLTQPDSRTYEFGAWPSNLSEWILVQSGRFFLWGFDNSPADYTPAGSSLFVNTVWYLLNILSRDTLVLTDYTRMNGIGFPAGDVTTLQTRVTELIGLPFASSNMNAITRDLALDGPDSVVRAYTAWSDANMSSASSTNGLATAIDGYIEKLKRAAYPNLKYVILTGSHEVIPMKVRPADNYVENDWGIPSGYLYDLAHSGTKGAYLTDTIYSDLSYITDGWAPNSELVPELSVGRLVETPAQINTLISTYIASNGSMSRTNRVAIASNDYLDGAQAAADAMGPGADATLNQSGFTSNLVSPLLNSKHGIIYFGGHGDFNWMTTRKWDQGYMPGSTGTQGDTEELVDLPNAVFAAAGCHNGAVFTNMKYRNYDGTTTYADFPERLANKKVGVYVASTGYTWITLSDASKSVAYVGFSERLTSLFVDKLLNSGATTAGKAFQAAAKQYATEKGALSDADRRVLAIATFYGIPNYRFSNFVIDWAHLFGYSIKMIPFTPAAAAAGPELQAVSNTQVTLTLLNWTVGADGVVQIPGAAYTGDENTPVLPVMTANWNLPGVVSGVNVVWNQGASQSTLLNNVVPNAPVGTTVNPGAGTVFQAQQSVFPHGFIPQSVQFSTTTSSLGGSDTTLSLGIMPVQYNPDSGQTRVWTKLVFDVSFTTDANAAAVDSDGDGLPNYWEDTYGLNPDSALGNDGAAGDPDQDGLTNQQELQAGTNPFSPDTDQDGIPDGQEVLKQWDPLDPGSPLSIFLPRVVR